MAQLGLQRKGIQTSSMCVDVCTHAFVYMNTHTQIHEFQIDIPIRFLLIFTPPILKASPNLYFAMTEGNT